MRLLRQGDTGQAVLNLQAALYRAGYPPGPLDGIYGPLTAAAVAKFQRDHGLRVNGIAGEQTLSTLETVLRNLDAKPESTPTPLPQHNWLITALLLGGLWYLMR